MGPVIPICRPFRVSLTLHSHFLPQHAKTQSSTLGWHFRPFRSISQTSDKWVDIDWKLETGNCLLHLLHRFFHRMHGQLAALVEAYVDRRLAINGGFAFQQGKLADRKSVV